MCVGEEDRLAGRGRDVDAAGKQMAVERGEAGVVAVPVDAEQRADLGDFDPAASRAAKPFGQRGALFGEPAVDAGVFPQD